MGTSADTREAERRRMQRAKRKSLLKLPLIIGGALLLPFRRMRPAQGMSGDARARRNEMMGLTAGVARKVGGARVKGLFRGEQKRAEIRRAAVEEATQQAVVQMGNMKGLSMKLGQMMSYINVLSEEGEEQMAVLQASVPPMAIELVDGVIEDQFGQVPDKIFALFETEPIAAASVGQVHRAQLRDGRAAAVKIQYPGVHETFEADLANMAGLTDMSALVMKADITEYVGMLNDSIMGELDYLLEARSQQRFADMYRDHPYVVIPNTVPEFCRPRVLVSEFVEGQRFQDAMKTRTQEERNHIGEIMYRFAFGCIMNGFFSGDPHPGNYLFPTDERVCFLDFGMVMDIASADHASKVAQIIAGALKGRQDLIDDGLREVGFLPEGGPSGEEVWTEIKSVIAGPIDEDAVTRLDRHAFQKGMEKLMDPRGKLNQASMKTDHFEGWAAICMRYAVGSLASISKFAPEANWRHIIGEIVLGEPPQTEIGERWGDAPGGGAFIGSRFTD